jgi:hypothetical protein
MKFCLESPRVSQEPARTPSHPFKHENYLLANYRSWWLAKGARLPHDARWKTRGQTLATHEVFPEIAASYSNVVTTTVQVCIDSSGA